MRPLSLVLLLACTACTPSLPGAWEFLNGDFEAPEVGPDGAPVGWHLYEPPLPPGTSIEVDTLRSRGGTRAVRISDSLPDGSCALQSRFYPAVAGRQYTASAWVYNGSGDGWLYLEFYASPTRRISEVHRGCGVTGQWEQIEISEVCPPEARYAVVLLYSSVGNVGVSAWDDITLTGPAGEGEVLSLERPKEAVVDYSYLRNVGSAKQLLFDDAFLETHTGLWWRICPPRKTGERNLVADKPWEDFLVNAWCTVMEDDGRYRMWYEAYDKSYTSDLQARYCYAESTDGIHWTKPSLGIETFNGSTDNNILFNGLGGEGVHGGTVFKDPTAPEAQRYKFVYLGPVGKEQYAVHGAVSPDGLHWTPCPGGPILEVSSDTQTVCFFDERLGRYVTYCRLWTPDRTVGRSESESFLSFPPAEEVLACDERDPADADLYNNAAIKYPYAENAYLIFTSMYHHTGDNLDVHLAVSRDGVHWTRPERRPYLANGNPGEMDDATIYAGVGVLRTGDELSMYTHASRTRHNQVYPDLVSADGAYTRSTLRLDGYVAMDAGKRPAEFTTHPLVFTGNRLEINADVRPGGYVKLELQDAAGAPIPGFSLDDCAEITGDSVRHVVSWKGGADLSAPAGKPTRVRGIARDASLYAFQFAAE